MSTGKCKQHNISEFNRHAKVDLDEGDGVSSPLSEQKHLLIGKNTKLHHVLKLPLTLNYKHHVFNFTHDVCKCQARNDIYQGSANANPSCIYLPHWAASKKIQHGNQDRRAE